MVFFNFSAYIGVKETHHNDCKAETLMGFSDNGEISDVFFERYQIFRVKSHKNLARHEPTYSRPYF